VSKQVAALQQQNPGSIESVHMSYLQNQADTSASGSSQAAPAVPQITFLYKLVPGVADRSFGLNVARMAHLPTTVVDRAARQAEHLEEVTVHRARCVAIDFLQIGNHTLPPDCTLIRRNRHGLDEALCLWQNPAVLRESTFLTQGLVDSLHVLISSMAIAWHG